MHSTALYAYPVFKVLFYVLFFAGTFNVTAMILNMGAIINFNFQED